MSRIRGIPRRVRLARLVGRFGVDTSGAVAVIVAILAPVLIGMIGLGTEAGFWYMTQRKLQNAADAGAHGAAMRMRAGDEGEALRRMVDYLARQSDVEVDDADLAVSTPPTGGTYAGDGSAVEVTLTERLPRLFTGIYTMEPIAIAARAVALVESGGTGCVLALGDTDGAITVTGSSDSSLSLCDMVSNATGEAFVMAGNGASVSANCVQTVGTAVTTNRLTVSCNRLREHSAAVADPFRDVPEPALTGPCQSSSVGANATDTTVTPVDAHASGLPSRRYCSGLTLRGNVTFQPGIYLIEGGTFQINSNARIAGENVMFYLAPGVALQFSGTARLELSAPDSGVYAGMLFFSSRASTGVSHMMNGNLGSILDGAIYAASSHLTVSGSARTAADGCTQFVTRTVEFSGGGTLDISCTDPAGESIEIMGSVSLVE